MKRFIVLYLITIIPIYIFGQRINGSITDNNGKPLNSVNISVVGESGGSISNSSGNYEIKVTANRYILIAFSSIGYNTEKIRIPALERNQSYSLDVIMKRTKIILEDVVVKDKKDREKGLTRIKIKHVDVIPGINGIETILKTLPGVSSANELSSQYSVRGGNFDENLVYVNGIEVYRPFLIHSGQQEGLSFVNKDLVSNIEFSAGGFSAKYGDKMSSVLDIRYRKPRKHAASLSLSLLGASAHVEGVNNSKKFSYLFGVRHKTNQYLLGSMDTDADYNPRFSDIQTLLNYNLSDNWSINILGNLSKNRYQMIPKDRQTEFGTVNEALKLSVYFDGQELDEYTTYFGALTTKYKNDNLGLSFTGSAFQTYEEENFDIIGEYYLFQLDNNLGSNSFGDIKFDRGIGKYMNHARNSLNARVINFTHNGIFNYLNNELIWGFRMQKETINDKISEWTLIDSAGYISPRPQDNIGGNPSIDQQIFMSQLLKTEINLNSYRNSGYIELTKNINNFSIISGTRGVYWTFNEEFLLSPRVSIAYAPLWEQDVVFRTAVGVYYQAPFYRELRDLDGSINYDAEAQKSTHFLLGSDYIFYKWGRPFKWVSELYYKDLENLIPYKVDNVRIQYLANEKSNGYAAGIDMKINGEFVPGIESWASISIMTTQEDILNDSYLDINGNMIEPGFIPRPTDQRFSFSIFFQDYIPRNPNYKMHLNLVYGSGLPFGPPKAEKFQDILRIPPYRRVDIGFSVIIKEAGKKLWLAWLDPFKSIWLSAEVFNLLDIDNTVSYLWVSDVSGREYAVPNYLTSRLLNAKLSMTF